MGGQMANRFLEKGHTVTGHNRTRSRAQWLIDKGMKWADSPRAVAAAVDVTFSMVRDPEAFEQTADGPNGLLAGLAPGKIWVDMSTVGPAMSREMAGRVREK